MFILRLGLLHYSYLEYENYVLQWLQWSSKLLISLPILYNNAIKNKAIVDLIGVIKFNYSDLRRELRI